METLTVLCFCHSEYSEIWEAYFESLQKTMPTVQTVMAVNSKSFADVFFSVHPHLKPDMILEYNEQESIPHRLLKILPQLKTEFVLYLSDNNLLTHVDHASLGKILVWLHEKNYDTIQFVGGPETYGFETIDDAIVVKPSYDSYPFSFLPSVWRVTSFYYMMGLFQNSSYRSIELDVQPFLRASMKCFRPACLGPTKICNLYNKMEPYFQFMHVLGSRKWANPEQLCDFQEEFWSMIKKYKIDLSVKGIHQ